MDSRKLHYELEKITELRKIKRGDQIAVPCSTLNVECYRFGIYLGETEGVAEFGVGYLRVIDFFAFKGDAILFRSAYQPGECQADEVVAKTAKDLIKNPQSWGTYNPRNKNSEHFATYCKTGTAFNLHEGQRTLLDKIVFEALIIISNVSGSLSKSSGSSPRDTLPSSSSSFSCVVM